jgi:hypothetical protein
MGLPSIAEPLVVPHADMLAATDAQPQRPRTLTDLQKELDSWTKELRAHTAARNFLYRAFEGSVPLPMLSLSGQGIEASINMKVLPEKYAQAIVTVLLEHEERNVLNAWEQVCTISENAKEVIAQINAQTGEGQERDVAEYTEEEGSKQDDRGEKLGAIARGMMEEIARGEPEPI